MADKKSTTAPPASKDVKTGDEALDLPGVGTVTNRDDLQGTIQTEPTPEELPADAKIAPINEQVAPNQAALAVGALEQPDEIAGVKQPEEGKKIVTDDMSDAAEFLAEGSDQQDAAKRANEGAKRDADEGRI